MPNINLIEDIYPASILQSEMLSVSEDDKNCAYHIISSFSNLCHEGLQFIFYWPIRVLFPVIYPFLFQKICCLEIPVKGLEGVNAFYN